MPSFYPSRKLSKYTVGPIQDCIFQLALHFQHQTLQYLGCEQTPHAFNGFFFYFIFLLLFFYYHCLVLFFFYSLLAYILCCLAKPITPLCWYLLVLGYSPVLHPIFTSYVHSIYVHLDEWYFSPKTNHKSSCHSATMSVQYQVKFT